MVRIQFPGQGSAEGAALPAMVRNGVLVEVRQRHDLARLIDLCGELAFPRSWTFAPDNRRRLPDDFLAEPFSQLVGALMAGALSTAGVGQTPEDPDQLGERVLSVEPRAERPFDGLLIGLATIYQLWQPDDDLVVLVGLGFPADRGADDEVSLILSKPRAALWMAPGSLFAGITVGTTLKVAKWCALVASPFTATTAEAASKRLVERLRDQGQAASRHPPFPRLDQLVQQDRAAIQGRPVLVVLLHGLFSTDLGTFDGFITHLRRSTPVHILDSLARLQGSNGIAELSAAFKAGLGCDRVSSVSDVELAQFADANVALLGWPHDSLAPIDTSAIKLAALLNNELKAAPPRHVVFVCHSQGGLLARKTALQLMRMKGPVNWVDHLAGIVTFGTPHEGAAIAEPGFRRGREAAVYLMMLSGTGKVTSIGDVLTLVGERVAEGIEDLKAFNASTHERENTFVAKLLDEESAVAWRDGSNRPPMLVVGGTLGATQKDSWRRKLAAGFITHKLGHDDHDLVVELSSSTSRLVDATITVQVESDHFSYFDGEGRSQWAVDAAVAFVWTLLTPEIGAWCDALAASDEQRAKMRNRAMTRRFELLKNPAQTPPAPKPPDTE